MSKNVKVAVIGASGYSGEELVRLLLNHPQADLVAVTSRQYVGKTVAEIFPKFASYPSAKRMTFTEPDAASLADLAEVVFLAADGSEIGERLLPVEPGSWQVGDIPEEAHGLRLRVVGNGETTAAEFSL